VGPTARTDDQWRALLADQIRQHARLWFRLAFDVLRDPHVAEDVCQAALLRAWEHRDRLREPALLRAWLARTVVNESLTVLRRRQTERRALDKFPRLESAAASDEALTTREAAIAALDALPEPIRVVVALRVMEGMSGNEVMNLLGCSASQVSRMLHEGLERLRVLMTDQGVEVKGGRLP
jgi:RNA polymerase sigma-70 factor (ECF subfamily)